MESINPYINLLIQVPLVGVFIWFAIRQTEMFLSALEKRDVAWREFLSEQRHAGNRAIERLADEIKEISSEVAELRGKVNP